MTADSVSMLSEACATGRPVLIAGEAPGRHAALAESLCAAGYASRLSAPGLPHPAAPLDEGARVAARLRELGFA